MADWDGKERRDPQQCAFHESMLYEMKDDIKELMKYIKGNGKIGIGGKVDVLWSSQMFVIAAIVTLAIKSLWGLL